MTTTTKTPTMTFMTATIVVDLARKKQILYNNR